MGCNDQPGQMTSSVPASHSQGLNQTISQATSKDPGLGLAFPSHCGPSTALGGVWRGQYCHTPHLGGGDSDPPVGGTLPAPPALAHTQPSTGRAGKRNTLKRPYGRSSAGWGSLPQDTTPAVRSHGMLGTGVWASPGLLTPLPHPALQEPLPQRGGGVSKASYQRSSHSSHSRPLTPPSPPPPTSPRPLSPNLRCQP